MRHLNISADDAYRYIKARRSYISPNFNFLGQLSEYERSLPLSSTVTAHMSPSSSIPIMRCAVIEPTLNDRRRFVQVESSSCSTTPSLKREYNHDRPKVPSRPQGFNFDLVNTRRPQSLLSPSSGIANLSVASPHQHMSLPTKLLRPNSITLKRSSPTGEDSSSSELTNSKCPDESSSATNKRVKTLPRSTDTSPLLEKNDLVNSFFEATSSALSKSPHRSNSTHSLDSATETTTTTTANKSRPNSLSSSRELLVS